MTCDWLRPPKLSACDVTNSKLRGRVTSPWRERGVGVKKAA